MPKPSGAFRVTTKKRLTVRLKKTARRKRTLFLYFCEGNTRAAAVFIVKYLKSFGFAVNNDVFAINFWYFCNALVRANYSNLQKGIDAVGSFLENFFENLLLGVQHELKNRYLHADYKTEAAERSAAAGTSKCNSCTLNCTLEELAFSV